MNEVVANLCRLLAAFRGRRAMVKVRRQFAKSGHPLDGLSDSQVEAALTNGKYEITDVVLSAKIINHALRRLAAIKIVRPEVVVKEAEKARCAVIRGERALGR